MAYGSSAHSKWLLASSVALALAASCASRTGTVYLTGNSTAVGAQVFIDGRLVGTLSSERFTGEPSPDSDIRKGEPFGTLNFEAERGLRRIAYVSARGDTASETINVTGETYWSVSFLPGRTGSSPSR